MAGFILAIIVFKGDEMSYHYFTSQTDLYNHIKKYHEDLDVNTSLSMTRHSFADTDGGQYLAYSLEDFVEVYNNRFGKTFLKGKCQVAGKTSYLIYFEDDIEVKGTKHAVQEQKQIEETTLPEEQEVTSDKEVVATEVADVDSLPEIDWEWVDSLSNNKYGKKDLEDYAKPYEIDLKKNMSINNMRKAFREHMGVE